jgi:hypothetical protein
LLLCRQLEVDLQRVIEGSLTGEQRDLLALELALDLQRQTNLNVPRQSAADVHDVGADPGVQQLGAQPLELEHDAVLRIATPLDPSAVVCQITAARHFTGLRRNHQVQIGDLDAQRRVGRAVLQLQAPAPGPNPGDRDLQSRRCVRSWPGLRRRRGGGRKRQHPSVLLALAHQPDVGSDQVDVAHLESPREQRQQVRLDRDRLDVECGALPGRAQAGRADRQRHAAPDGEVHFTQLGLPARGGADRLLDGLAKVLDVDEQGNDQEKQRDGDDETAQHEPELSAARSCALARFRHGTPILSPEHKDGALRCFRQARPV